MAYVHPREAPRDILEGLLRNGIRFIAVSTYGTAVVIAVVLLAPVLFDGDAQTAAQLPKGPETVVYTAQRGESLPEVASAHGLSLAQLFALNPRLTPFSHTRGKELVVGLR
jgi:LysM repeat protein